MSNLRRLKPVSILVLLILTAPLSSWCQSVQDQLNSAFKGKILLLRNFYSGTDLSYDENGKLLGTATQVPWTLANMQISKVTVTTRVEISGNRMGTLYRDGKPGFVNLGKLKIHVAEPTLEVSNEITLGRILNKIFIEPGEDLRPMVQDYWRSYFNGTDMQSRSADWKAALGKETLPTEKGKEVTPPRAISQTDPH